jgi:exopolysaccharide biosynthesis polyprenyl glycosylphosphotransferase
MTSWWQQLIEQGRLPRLLTVVDVLLVNLAFFTAWWARYQLGLGGVVEPRFYAPYTQYLPTALALTLLMLANLNMEGLYRNRRGATWFDQLYSVVNATTTSILLIVVFFFFYRPGAYSRLIFAYAAALIVVYLAFARLALRWWLGWLRTKGVGITRTLIVGAGETGRTLMRHIVAQPGLGYQVIGFVDDEPENQHDIGRFPALGGTADIPALARKQRVDTVIITLPWQHQRKIMMVLEQCERQKIKTRIVPDLFQLSLTRVSVDEIKGVPLIAMKEPSLKGANLALKRIMDVAITSTALLLLSPLMLLVALAIRLESEGPVIFKQIRVGRAGQLFPCYKFRSMRAGAENEVAQLAERNEADGPLFKIRDDPRVTRVGKFIRKTSLDELPQLWNVLKGDMSLIGPRPALPHEVAQYQEWHRKRLDAAPGLTGLWQVSGRSDVTFDEMVLLDIYYAEQWSPMLDTLILLKTVPTVLFQRGAY